MFCMLYALAGIPLNLVMFQSLGERLNIFVTYLLHSLKKCLRLTDTNISQTHLIFISMNMSSLVVIGGAWAFSHYEVCSSYIFTLCDVSYIVTSCSYYDVSPRAFSHCDVNQCILSI